MACFSLAWFENLLIWVLIFLFVVAVVKVVIPSILAAFGPSPPGADVVFTVLRYLVWTIVAIALVVFLFDLIRCMDGGRTSFQLPLIRR